jgi:transposase
MNKEYTVRLAPHERDHLQMLVRKGYASARIITRARILLKVDRDAHTDDVTSAALDVGVNTVQRTRKRYCTRGLDRALYDKQRPGAVRSLTPKQEAHLVAIACTTPPLGRDRWTLDLLVAETKKKVGRKIGRSTVHQILLRNDTKPWLKKNVVH